MTRTDHGLLLSATLAGCAAVNVSLSGWAFDASRPEVGGSIRFIGRIFRPTSAPLHSR
jgi:hypothetical protein